VAPAENSALRLADIPVVYLIGAPRSGTTWLQLMLASHYAIVSPPELDFFPRFVNPWYEEWERHCLAARGWPKPPYLGLPSVLTTGEFEQAVGELLATLYRKLLAAKLGATIVLEKDPNYSECVPTILRTVPHARFVHLIRDGRDVSASLMRVARSWGRTWAPPGGAASARRWKSAVRHAREAIDAPGGYLELRYEELLAPSGAQVLAETLAFCGAPDAADSAAVIFEAYRYRGDQPSVLSGGVVVTGEAALHGPPPTAPAGFIGQARSGSWRELLSYPERRAINAMAGDLLLELGYVEDAGWVDAAGLDEVS
jgi:hypothetical protein